LDIPKVSFLGQSNDCERTNECMLYCGRIDVEDMVDSEDA
jgi:hypothetical protein